jgi:hypothetical protein
MTAVKWTKLDHEFSPDVSALFMQWSPEERMKVAW